MREPSLPTVAGSSIRSGQVAGLACPRITFSKNLIASSYAVRKMATSILGLAILISCQQVTSLVMLFKCSSAIVAAVLSLPKSSSRSKRGIYACTSATALLMQVVTMVSLPRVISSIISGYSGGVRSASVSYTHLDVYKRQPAGCSCATVLPGI